MIKPVTLFLSAICLIAACDSKKSAETESVSSGPEHLRVERSQDGETISVYRAGSQEPLVTQNARKDFRPYLHPINAPDGKGVLTEYSPGHHKHQTGLYWGFTRVNGRDYFHNPTGDYWRKVSAEIVQDTGTSVQWRTVYDLLDETGVLEFMDQLVHILFTFLKVLVFLFVGVDHGLELVEVGLEVGDGGE